MRRLVTVFAATGLFLAAGIGVSKATDDKPKYTIKEVMKAAHAKDALLDKVKAGTASKEDKDKLVEYYTALNANKPKKGAEKSWKDKTDAVLTAAKDVVDGKDGAVDKLKAATMCMGCHSVHK